MHSFVLYTNLSMTSLISIFSIVFYCFLMVVSINSNIMMSLFLFIALSDGQD